MSVNNNSSHNGTAPNTTQKSAKKHLLNALWLVLGVAVAYAVVTFL